MNISLSNLTMGVLITSDILLRKEITKVPTDFAHICCENNLLKQSDQSVHCFPLFYETSSNNEFNSRRIHNGKISS